MEQSTLPHQGSERQRLRNLVLDAIQRSGRRDLQQLTVNVNRDQVVLEGEVGTYYAKQLAQSLAGKIRGVESLLNSIQVRCDADPCGSQ